MDVRTIQIRHILSEARIRQQMYANHECTALEVEARTANEKIILLGMHIQLLEDKAKELQSQVDRECVWTRVNNSYSCWDEYDAWSTSCGEDYAIEEEWHDKITPYCSNCGGKVIEGQKK